MVLRMKKKTKKVDWDAVAKAEEECCPGCGALTAKHAPGCAEAIRYVIRRIEERMAKVELPWVFSSNEPFDVTVLKPRHSLSKHTSDRQSSWHCDDGYYLAICVNEMPRLLKYIHRLEGQVSSGRGTP